MIRTMPTNCPTSVNRAFLFLFLFFFPRFLFLFFLTAHKTAFKLICFYRTRFLTADGVSSRIDYVTLRYDYAQSWEDLGILQSLRGSRRPRDNRGLDTGNVIWFDTTRRGCTVVYIHGGVAACYVTLCVGRVGI